MEKSRRNFIRNMAGIGTGLAASSVFPGILSACKEVEPMFFSISLAQWSLHKSMKRWIDGAYSDVELDPLDFPVIARNQFGIDAVEYVNQFFFDKGEDQTYLKELKNRCDSEGVKSVLIMVDSEGNLGAVDGEVGETHTHNPSSFDMNRKNAQEKHSKQHKITTATAAPAPMFDTAKACSYTFTVNVRVPALPPVKRKMSSNLLNVQMKRSRNKTDKIPISIGRLR